MGMAINVGGEKAGQKFVCGNRNYEVDKEGMVYVLDDDAQGFIDSGYKAEETRKKPVIANEKDLKDIPMTTKTAVEESPVDEKVEEMKEEVKVEGKSTDKKSSKSK